MESWESVFQDFAKSALNTYTEVKYKQPLEMRRMELEAYGPQGRPYMEGQPAVTQTVAGIPQSWLLIGGALLVAIVLVKN
jgi:hypothetical protein